MNASHRPAAVVAALGGLLEAFRQGRIVARSAERDGMERHAGPLTASWNARFPGFPSEDFPYASFWGETRRARRDAHLIDVIVELLAGRPAGETTIVNAACVFGRHACRLAARLPEACVVGADIDPRWDRLYRLRQGRHVPSNYRFVQDDLFRPRLDVRLVSARSLGACRACPGHDQHSRRLRGAIGHRSGPAVTRAFVADASVAIAWVHPAQATPSTGAMLEAVAEGATLQERSRSFMNNAG